MSYNPHALGDLLRIGAGQGSLQRYLLSELSVVDTDTVIQDTCSSNADNNPADMDKVQQTSVNHPAEEPKFF